MDKPTVRKFKLFWMWQDCEEEAWLRQMAQQGYHLSKLVFSTIYEFTLGEPRDMIYRMDYTDVGKKELDEYMQLFEGSGWEYVDGAMGWFYFRKLADPESADEIYTDAESKIQKYSRMLSIIIIFPIVLGGVFLPRMFKEDAIPLLSFLAILTMGFFIYAIGRLVFRIWQLKRL